MFLKPLSFVFIASAALVLQGCSSFYGKEGLFRGKSRDYLEAGSIEPITVPEDVESKSLEPLFALPETLAKDDFGDNVDLSDFDVPRPSSLVSEASGSGVKIQRVDDQAWIFLRAPASQIWPRTQSYLSLKGVPVFRTDISKGLIEAGPIKVAGFEDNSDKYAIFIEKGLLPESTEVRIQNLSQSYEGETEFDRALLRELAEVLAAELNNKSASLLGQNVGGVPKSLLARVNGEPALRLNTGFDRATAVLKRAVVNSEFVFWDEAYSSSVIYAGYIAEEEKSSAFVRFFGLGKSVPKKPRVKLENILNSLSADESVKRLFSSFDGVAYSGERKREQGFLIVLKAGESGFYDVVVRSHNGDLIDADLAKSLLLKLRKNLV